MFLSKEKSFVREVRSISGYTPKEVFLYRLAFSHSSLIGGQPSYKIDSAKYCNERLEFLGDSVLDTVVADYLFKIYPRKDEGFLTEMRSKIVNRKSLNEICRKLRLDSLIAHNQSGSINESMYGDALEAFIGAIYLDLGYGVAQQFVLNKIISSLIKLDNVEDQVISYKNKLIEYTQKNKMGILSFEVIEEQGFGHQKTFIVQAKTGDKILGTGVGKNKKTAEQKASEDAISRLKINISNK